MDARTIELLAVSFARISANKNDAATIFYARLFTTAPHLRAMFRPDLEEQKHKLMLSLAQIVDFHRVGCDPDRFLTCERRDGERSEPRLWFDALR